MHQDVTELRDFYLSPLGLAARRILAHRIRARWRQLDGRTVMGLGFASPYLGIFRGEALRLGALMPAQQGALLWPTDGALQAALVEENALPLPDASVDRLLAVHCLETTESARQLLREIWRVLAPEGRLLIIVPNRRGLWARRDTTPFGHGRPWSRSQLEQLLSGALLTPVDWSPALFMPPSRYASIVRAAAAWERMGARFWPAFSGVILVEAQKELVQPLTQRARARSLQEMIAVRPVKAMSQRSGDRAADQR